MGNVMIDTLFANMAKFKAPDFLKDLDLVNEDYFVLTLHRPTNVDDGERLKSIIHEILRGTHDLPVIFPMHPRTKKIFNGIEIDASNLNIVEPLGYHEFNYLVQHSKAVITDSGGITANLTQR